MRTFTKKHGFFAVAVSLLVVTAMIGITGCSNGISGGGNSTGDFTPPTGKGAVKLSFNKEIARTILPDDATLATFTKFDFAFTATGGGATSYTKENILPANLYDAITLDPGNYNLTVYAYIDTDPVAKNDPPVPIVITRAKTTSATIVLRPYNQSVGTDTGTFNYTISSTIDPDDIASAEISLTPILSGVAQLNIDVTSDWDDGDDHDISVRAGDYYLDFIVEVETGETVTFRHIIQIYKGMISSYEFIITPDYFNAVFQLISGDLTYEHPQDNLPILSDDAGLTVLAKGATIEVEQGDTVTITVTNATDFDSFEWYSQDTTSLGASASYIVNAASDGEFFAKKTYLLTVVGIIDTKKYYTFINIKVVKP